MIQYILFLLVFVILMFYAYIKLKYPFWSSQPVYHTYDYLRTLCYKPFIINKYNPFTTKFCNFENIKTNYYNDCKDSSKLECANLIQCFYLNTDRILYTLNKNDLDNLFSGQLEPSILSIYFENEYKNVIDSSGSQIVVQKTPIGTISSRSLKFWYVDTYSKNNNYEEMTIYFIDNLCVDRNKKRTKLFRELLQTHEHKQRKINPNICVSLIKKEIELFEGVIPFVSYNTHTFKLRNYNIQPLPPHTFVVELENNKMDVLVDFLYTNNDYCMKTKLYDILIFPDIGNIEQMVKQKLLYIYCLRNREHVLGFYFFKDAKMYYEELEGNTLQFIGSVMNCLQPTVFYNGFLHSLRHILKKESSYSMMLFEDIGHNQIILEFWNSNHNPVFTNKTAYYFYNFVYPGSPVSKQRLFILN